MNEVRHLLRSASALLVAVVVGTSDAWAEQGRPVHVSVTVRDAAGHGLTGIVVGLAIDAGRQPVIDALTDDAGHAVLDASVPELQPAVEIRHGFAHPSTLSNEEQVQASRRMEEVQMRHHLDRAHSVALEPGRPDYDLTITAWPAIEVNGVIVDENGARQSGFIMGPPRSFSGAVDLKHGVAKPLRSVRQSASSLIFVTSSVSPPATIVHPIQLSEAQTRMDVDLGEVRIDRLTDDVPIHVRIAAYAGLAEEAPLSDGPLPGLTVVSTDGTLIVSYRAMSGTPESDVISRLAFKEEQPPRLPPGKYYVAPGWFFYSDDQVGLITAVLDGKDLHESAIPMIEVTKDGPNDFEINVLDAHNAIRRLATSGAEARGAEK